MIACTVDGIPHVIGRGTIDSDPCTSMVFSPDGNRLIVGTVNGVLSVHDTTDLSPLTFDAVSEFPIENMVHGNEFLVFSCRDGGVRTWKPDSKITHSSFKSRTVTALAISEDSRTLAVGSSHASIEIVDLRTQDTEVNVGCFPDAIKSVFYTAGAGLLVLSGGKLQEFDPRYPEIINEIGNYSSVDMVNGFTMACLYKSIVRDPYPDVQTRLQVRTTLDVRSDVVCQDRVRVRLSGDSRTVVTASIDGTITEFDTDGRVLRTHDTMGPCENLVVSPGSF
jgi:WD40 repeat protein